MPARAGLLVCAIFQARADERLFRAALAHTLGRCPNRVDAGLLGYLLGMGRPLWQYRCQHHVLPRGDMFPGAPILARVEGLHRRSCHRHRLGCRRADNRSALRVEGRLRVLPGRIHGPRRHPLGRIDRPLSLLGRPDQANEHGVAAPDAGRAGRHAAGGGAGRCRAPGCRRLDDGSRRGRPPAFGRCRRIRVRGSVLLAAEKSRVDSLVVYRDVGNRMDDGHLRVWIHRPRRYRLDT